MEENVEKEWKELVGRKGKGREREKMTVDLKGRNGSKRERDGGKERGMEKRKGNVK